jgi:hypothetical protein
VRGHLPGCAAKADPIQMGPAASTNRPGLSEICDKFLTWPRPEGGPVDRATPCAMEATISRWSQHPSTPRGHVGHYATAR